jgi:hypothetical protein
LKKFKKIHFLSVALAHPLRQSHRLLIIAPQADGSKFKTLASLCSCRWGAET